MLGGAIEFEFDESLSAGLKALGQRHGATLFMTLLAAWGAVLVRLSGQDEVVIGTPVANRRRSELEPMIGFFVNTLALRLDSAAAPAWRSGWSASGRRRWARSNTRTCPLSKWWSSCARCAAWRTARCCR